MAPSNVKYVAVGTIHHKDELADKKNPPTTVRAGQGIPDNMFTPDELRDYEKRGVIRRAGAQAEQAGSALLPGEAADNPTTVTDEAALGELDMDANGKADKNDLKVTKDSTATRTTTVNPSTGAKSSTTSTHRSNKR